MEKMTWILVRKKVVEGPADCICRYEIVEALNEMITGKAHEPSDVSLELIGVSGEVGNHVMAEICQNPRYEIVEALNEMITGKAHEPSDVSLELIGASGEVGNHVMAEICQNPRWIWNAS